MATRPRTLRCPAAARPVRSYGTGHQCGQHQPVKGLLRHDLAKGADLRRYDQGTRDDIADRMNRRPQQTLNCNHHQKPRVCPCRAPRRHVASHDLLAASSGDVQFGVAVAAGQGGCPEPVWLAPPQRHVCGAASGVDSAGAGGDGRAGA
jgi:hypothetical protein